VIMADPANAKMVAMLEKAEKRIAKKRNEEIEDPPRIKAQKTMANALRSGSAAERNLKELSEAILYLAEIGQKEELPPECLRNLAVVFRDHFTNTNVIANAMYALGAVAHTTMKVHTDLWNVMVKCVIAALRCHQDDQLVLSNGVYALGSMCTTSIGLRERVVEWKGVETIVYSMALHEEDHILQSNGCLALARICGVPKGIPNEDSEFSLGILQATQEIQKQALELGAMEVILLAEQKHSDDPVLSRACCEAAAAITTCNILLNDEEFEKLAEMIARVMAKEYHEIETVRNKQPVPPEEQHGLDEFVVAYGSRALGQMCLVRSTDKAAGTHPRFPLVVSGASKQKTLAKAGGIHRMCEALVRFPRKKVVLSSVAVGLAQAWSRHEENQRLAVKLKGVEQMVASMHKWQEDEPFVHTMLHALKVLLQGSEGERNHWYLDTLRGRDTAKFVVKTATAEANDAGNAEMIAEAQEMARQWLPERKHQGPVEEKKEEGLSPRTTLAKAVKAAEEAGGAAPPQHDAASAQRRQAVEAQRQERTLNRSKSQAKIKRLSFS